MMCKYCHQGELFPINQHYKCANCDWVMDRKTLEKLDNVLSKLEVIHVFSLKIDNVALQNLSMETINILDEIIPRPLPTEEE